MCPKNIETEGSFTKTEIDNEWSIISCQNSLFGIQRTYSSKFSIMGITSETSLIMSICSVVFYIRNLEINFSI